MSDPQKLLTEMESAIRLGAKDFAAAMGAAKRAGDDQVAIVKACIAAEAKSAKGGASPER
jgi:hypothetical protein